jgi:hypothetical protein
MPNGTTPSAFNSIMRPFTSGIPIGRTRIMIGQDPVHQNGGIRVEHPVGPVKVFVGGSGGLGPHVGGSIGVRGTF